MIEEELNYLIDNQKYIGTIFTPSEKKLRYPAVLVAHAWMGKDSFAKEQAKKLAKLGYLSFAIDLYGNETVAENTDQAAQLMTPLFKDRKELRKRMVKAFEAIKSHPKADPHNIGAIGFCFGGLSVIELLKSGVAVKGVVSFHGLLGDRLMDIQAKTEPLANQIKGSVLILHGHDDPLVSKEDIDLFQKEMTDAHVDWQMNIYGLTSHAFTNPNANDNSLGLVYNQRSSDRAWEEMKRFFNELFV